MIDVGKISANLSTITSAQKSYKKLLKDALDALLHRDSDGRWPWSRFERVLPETTRVYEYETFRDYLKQWSRFALEDLERLFSDDADILRRLREADTGTHGGDRRSEDFKSDNVTLERSAPERGNSKAYTLERLHRTNPDLYDAVKRGKISANAAAIQAGFRKPPPTPLDLMRQGWSKASAEERAAFAAEIGALTTPQAALPEIELPPLLQSAGDVQEIETREIGWDVGRVDEEIDSVTEALKIKARGAFEPLYVRAAPNGVDGSDNTKFAVVGGLNRWSAAVDVLGLKTVPCRILSDEEYKRIQQWRRDIMSSKAGGAA
jgi:ParB-like nuclease domain